MEKLEEKIISNNDQIEKPKIPTKVDKVVDADFDALLFVVEQTGVVLGLCESKAEHQFANLLLEVYCRITRPV